MPYNMINIYINLRFKCKRLSKHIHIQRIKNTFKF